MSKTTQCPNCLKTFVISEQQFQKSQGNVRCGSCREVFTAELIDDNAKAHQHSDHENNTTLTQDDNNEAPSFLTYEAEFEDNFQSELSIEEEEEDSSSNSVDDDEISIPIFVQTEIDLPTNQSLHQDQDRKLINNVDQLIDDKVVTDNATTTNSAADNQPQTDTNQDRDFIEELNPHQKQNWFSFLLLVIACFILLFGALYQLWHRQAIPWVDDEKISNLIEPLTNSIIGQLSDKLGVSLPVRRDLNNLQLLSARTEAHPSRSSTTLLRVSLINHSEISQPYPWLELSLSDENGRIVSRRALSPDNYLHNNQIQDLIGPRELRPITIEFLSFPEQAQGYELKILNN